VGIPPAMSGPDNWRAVLREAIARAILAERERCARLCEMTASRHGWNYNLPSVGREMADRIRSPLSNTEGMK